MALLFLSIMKVRGEVKLKQGGYLSHRQGRQQNWYRSVPDKDGHRMPEPATNVLSRDVRKQYAVRPAYWYVSLRCTRKGRTQTQMLLPGKGGINTCYRPQASLIFVRYIFLTVNLLLTSLRTCSFIHNNSCKHCEENVLKRSSRSCHHHITHTFRFRTIIIASKTKH